MLILLTFNTELRKMNIFAASTKIIKKFRNNYFLNNIDFAFLLKVWFFTKFELYQHHN